MIEEAWLSYAAQVIPPTAHKTQIRECRRAFYAGAHSLLNAMMIHLDPGSEPTEADLRRMDAIDGEFQKFQADMLAGKA